MIERLKAWALWALFGIGAILFALVKGRRDGKQLAQQEQQAGAAQDAAQASKEVRDVRTEVDSKAVGAADRQLRDEWMRDE